LIGRLRRSPESAPVVALALVFAASASVAAPGIEGLLAEHDAEFGRASAQGRFRRHEFQPHFDDTSDLGWCSQQDRILICGQERQRAEPIRPIRYPVGGACCIQVHADRMRKREHLYVRDRCEGQEARQKAPEESAVACDQIGKDRLEKLASVYSKHRRFEK
jgi:hypothetical protein